MPTPARPHVDGPARRARRGRGPTHARGVVAAAVIALAACGCVETVPQHPVCAAYLACYFFDGGTRYPHPDDGGVFDGGLFITRDGGPPRVQVYDYGSFHDEDVQALLHQAMGEGGYCWRKGFDGGTSAADCERACRAALVAECDRHDAFVAGDGGGMAPVCLDPARAADEQMRERAADESCTEMRALIAPADAGPGT